MDNNIAIQANNISKSYKNNKIIDGLNLTIEKNSFVTIFGKSGSGKTTLLNMLGLLEQPSSGEIFILNKKAPKINSREALLMRRNKISYLFQNFGLIDDETVGQNLDIGLQYIKKSKQEKESLKRKALQDVNLDIDLNSKIYTLSGGEQQRVAIAKTILKPSEIVLADEPTGSLDKDNKEDACNLLLELQKSGKTVVVVSHDLYFKNISDTIYDLNELYEGVGK